VTDSAEQGPDPATIDALGKISEALEKAERARGHLYSFHQLSGSADRYLQDGVAMLRAAGHDELAEEIDAGLVGRNVLPGKWTYQIVERWRWAAVMPRTNQWPYQPILTALVLVPTMLIVAPGRS